MLKLRFWCLPGIDGGPRYFGVYLAWGDKSIDIGINRDGLAVTRYDGGFRIWLLDFETGRVIRR